MQQVLMRSIPAILLLVCACLVAHSQPIPSLISQPPTPDTPISIKVAWNPSPDTNIWLYQVKVGFRPGIYDMTQLTTNIEPRDITNSLGQISTNVVMLTMTNLFLDQTNYFVVTAMNDIGIESLPSNELEVFIPSERPEPPGGLKLEMQVIPVFETSMNGIDWSRAGAGEPVILNNISDVRLVRVRLETSSVPSM